MLIAAVPSLRAIQHQGDGVNAWRAIMARAPIHRVANRVTEQLASE